ncbi:MAG: YARHG domain-containing protein [Bacteroidota bacterium]
MKKRLLLASLGLFSFAFAQTSFENLINRKGVIPERVAAPYFGEFAAYQLSVKEKLRVNSRDIFLLMSMTDGECYQEGLFMFDRSGEFLDVVEVTKICNNDGSLASYEQKEIAQIYTPDLLVVVKEQVDRVTDPEKLAEDQKHLAEGYNFFDDDVILGTSIDFKAYGLDEFGRLVEFCESRKRGTDRAYGFASCELLTPDRLYEYDPYQLRLMRNEIFAAKGYIFRSPDLKEYFREQTWYRGRSIDLKQISASLSSLERRNVATILAVEQGG